MVWEPQSLRLDGISEKPPRSLHVIVGVRRGTTGHSAVLCDRLLALHMPQGRVLHLRVDEPGEQARDGIVGILEVLLICHGKPRPCLRNLCNCRRLHQNSKQDLGDAVCGLLLKTSQRCTLTIAGLFFNFPDRLLQLFRLVLLTKGVQRLGVEALYLQLEGVRQRFDVSVADAVPHALEGLVGLAVVEWSDTQRRGREGHQVDVVGRALEVRFVSLVVNFLVGASCEHVGQRAAQGVPCCISSATVLAGGLHNDLLPLGGAVETAHFTDVAIPHLLIATERSRSQVQTLLHVLRIVSGAKSYSADSTAAAFASFAVRLHEVRLIGSTVRIDGQSGTGPSNTFQH
mmetsp:Transcript_68779/g.197223  ORF Transcript_68779/g.197223 Transcript_68779/m.197223 type:complete len:344 (-) Transcript_68779:325-1356(-)